MEKLGVYDSVETAGWSGDLPVNPPAGNVPPASETALRSGSGRFRLGMLGSGGNAPGRGIKPGKAQHQFSV